MNYANYFEDLGGSVSLHTTTHSALLFKGGLDKWTDELSTNYKALIELGQVKTIPGSRAPYLSYDNNYFQALLSMAKQNIYY